MYEEQARKALDFTKRIIGWYKRISFGKGGKDE